MSAYRSSWVLGNLLCVAGIGLSLYAYYVETSKEKDPSFKAACDFSPTMSCSKVFTSRYGRGFGLIEYAVGKDHWLNQPNSVYGIIFYSLHIFIGLMHTANAAFMQVVMSVMANLGSLYLAFILYFILEDFCIVCISTYIVNFLLLIISIYKHWQLWKVKLKRKVKKQS